MILIKIGGGENINHQYIAEDLINFKNNKKIIVLGANYLRNILAKRLNIEIKEIESESGIKSIYTNKEIIDLMLMSYSGLALKNFICLLNKHNIDSIGLTGIDGRLVIANKKIITAKVNGKIKLITDNYTGKIISLNKKLINLILENNYTLVITQPVISQEGEILNTDNDQLVYTLAKEMNPSKIIYLIEKPGILEDINNEKSLIKNLNINKINEFLNNKNLGYGIQKKLLYIKKIIEETNAEIFISSGLIKNPITNALKFLGTYIKNG
jgi:acetylglutamate/LysW-gamma-L-alpha-aminoadipate kinase